MDIKDRMAAFKHDRDQRLVVDVEGVTTDISPVLYDSFLAGCEYKNELHKLIVGDLKARIVKLESLLLLTDPTVSHLPVTHTQQIQYEEYIKAFPNE